MVRKILYWTFIILMMLPFLQFSIGLTETKPLNGAFILAEKPIFTKTSWYSGEFQNSYVKYIDDHIGFREYFIRIYNQYSYSLFNVARSPGSAVGKDGQLFIRSDIEGYLGLTFEGEDQIDEKLRRFKYIQDYFSLKGKTVFFVFAPGKSSLFPECIPDEYNVSLKSLTNFEYYKSSCNKLGIEYIDLDSYFKSLKGNTEYELYPKNGIHWSYYGMYLGMDSIIHYIEKQRNIDIPDLIVNNIRVSDSVLEPDNDVAENMNLIWRIPQPSLPYPEFTFSDEAFQEKPKVLVVSDSYYWQVYGGAMIPHNVFSFGGFWFYCNTAYAGGDESSNPVDSLNMEQELLDQDVIIIMGTEGTSDLFPYGLVDKAYEIFMPKDIEAMTNYYSWYLKNDPDWLASTKVKAQEENNTLEEQIHLESRWIALNYCKNLKGEELDILNSVEALKNDADRLGAVKEKAIDQDLDLNALILFEVEKELN